MQYEFNALRTGNDIHVIIFMIVQNSTIHCNLRLGTVQYITVPYSIVRYTVQYSSVLYSTVQSCTVQCSSVLYSIVQYNIRQCEFSARFIIGLRYNYRNNYVKY